MEHVLFIVIGIGVFLLGVRDLCILILCTEQIEAEHTGYRTYYGGGRYGIRKVDVPVFTYTYQGVSFQSQLAQNVPYKKLTENMEHGNIHPIYINSKHPQTVKETIGVGVNEKAALSSDKNCPFVYINFDFTLVNKVASL